MEDVEKEQRIIQLNVCAHYLHHHDGQKGEKQQKPKQAC